MHQKFLLDCDFEEVSLPDTSNLQEEFIQDFNNKTNFADNLIIENDMKESENPIIAEFQDSCLKAFYKQLEHRNKL